MDKKHTRRKKISDNAKATLLRWWIVGMCYFMIGFGTQAGGYTSPIDLIFFLGVGIGLVTIVVYNPIAYNVFDIVRGGEIVNHRYRNKKGWQRALQTLGDLGLSMLVVILVSQLPKYQPVSSRFARAVPRNGGGGWRTLRICHPIYSVLQCHHRPDRQTAGNPHRFCYGM